MGVGCEVSRLAVVWNVVVVFLGVIHIWSGVFGGGYVGWVQGIVCVRMVSTVHRCNMVVASSVGVAGVGEWVLASSKG